MGTESVSFDEMKTKGTRTFRARAERMFQSKRRFEREDEDLKNQTAFAGGICPSAKAVSVFKSYGSRFFDSVFPVIL